MNARHLFAYAVTALLVMPPGLSAQSHDASVGNHELQCPLCWAPLLVTEDQTPPGDNR